MITSARTSRALFASVAVLTALFTTAPPVTPPPPPPVGAAQCLLERVGTQYVRCDNLTGLGVPAPEWIPEQR